MLTRIIHRQRCEALGVRILCQTKAKKLVSDSSGRVTTVLAENKEREIKITAGSLIIATGNDIGGIDSDTYDLNLPGHSFGFAINSGRIAGENAAKSIRK